MKKVTIAIVAAVLMSVSSVDAAASKKKGMMDNMMNYGKKAIAGASKMGGQAVAGAKSMMGSKSSTPQSVKKR